MVALLHRSKFVFAPGLLALAYFSACSSDSEGNGDGQQATLPDFGGPTFNMPEDLDLGSAVLAGEVETFSGDPVDPGSTGANFSECAGIVQRAENLSRPTDIIFVIDNSSSMDGEIRQVQDRINEDFAAIIENSGVDYRVIMVSRYGDIDTQVGDTDNPICIGGDLGGQTCQDPENTPLQNTERFYHYSTDVRSREPWCRLLEGYASPDELTTDNERPNWQSIAPNGWGAFLRDGTFKSFVVITDDDSHCGPDVESDNRAPFRDVNGQPFNFNFDDGNNANQGMQAAEAFDEALRSLSPEHFGTADARNYDWYSIVGMNENDPPEAPWRPDQPIQTGTCGGGGDSEGPATGFQALSVMTGGLRYPSCRNDDFDAIFRAIATGVVEGSLTCEWTIPPIPASEGEFNPAQVNVVFTPSDGNKKLGQYVSGPNECVLGGWYFDNAENPQTVVACPETCNVLKGDALGQVNVLFGCDRIISVR